MHVTICYSHDKCPVIQVAAWVIKKQINTMNSMMIGVQFILEDIYDVYI